jgi:hypothetical protein
VALSSSWADLVSSWEAESAFPQQIFIILLQHLLNWSVLKVASWLTPGVAVTTGVSQTDWMMGVGHEVRKIFHDVTSTVYL